MLLTRSRQDEPWYLFLQGLSTYNPFVPCVYNPNWASVFINKALLRLLCAFIYIWHKAEKSDYVCLYRKGSPTPDLDLDLDCHPMGSPQATQQHVLVQEAGTRDFAPYSGLCI